MAGQTQGKPRRLRVDRSRRVSPQAYLKKCKALQEAILRERDGELASDSSLDIRAMREGSIR